MPWRALFVSPEFWLISGQLLVISALVALAATWLAAPLLKRAGIVDRPAPGKVHRHPVPRLGGVCIFVGFAAALLWRGPMTEAEGAILLGGVLVMVVGVLDDVWRVPAVAKLAALVVVTGLLYRSGVRLSLTTVVWLDVPLTFLWMVGMVSAMNALDHMDGLAVGVGLVAALMFFFVGAQTQQFSWAYLSIALAGGLLGFLVFNFHPARIFMGDSGAFFLGYTLAAMGVMGGWSTHPVKAAIIPVLILSVPIFDFAYVLASRYLGGTTSTILKTITYRGTDHLGHRLSRLGWRPQLVALFVYFVSVCVGVGAVVLRNVPPLEAVLLLGQLIMVYVIITILMHQHPAPAGPDAGAAAEGRAGGVSGEV